MNFFGSTWIFFRFHRRLFISLVILTSLVTKSEGIGAYMNALRSKRNITLNYGTRVQSTTSNNVNINLLLSSFQLEKNDKKYSKCKGIDIREISILELQDLFKFKKMTSVDLTNCYLQRIHHMNVGLRAVIEVNTDAVKLAYRADMDRKQGKRILSPLHGIPVLVKDNTATKDMMETTAGAWALLGIRPKRDADVIQALRKAGAVILGKANLSEMSNFRGLNIPNGWSGRGGQTRNPYNLLEDPLGSSSGSAVAVASNLATVSLGTETDGSLICPASANGVCTLRSTLGLISTHGVIPISHNQDVVGPMARTVTDLAILFDAMLPSKSKIRWACKGSYLKCLFESSNAKPYRIGIVRYPFWSTNVINSAHLHFELPLLDALIKSIKISQNFEVVDNISSPLDILLSISSWNELLVLLHDFKYDINEYLRNDVVSPISSPVRPTHQSIILSSMSRKIKNLSDIIQFNIDFPSPEGYDQELLIMADATDGLQNRTYVEAKDLNQGAAKAFLVSIINRYNLDAIVVPSECQSEGVLEEKLQDAVTSCNSISAIAGYPSISIPVGTGLKGVPFGINFIGKPYTENKLFKIAYATERLIAKRPEPRFLLS